MRLMCIGLAKSILFGPIHPRSDPTHTLWLSDCTVWIHLLSKAGEAALPIPWRCCRLTMGVSTAYWDEYGVCRVNFL
jgi:hypothetical protein